MSGPEASLETAQSYLRPLFLAPGDRLADPEDSLALAEHIHSSDIQRTINRLTGAEQSNARRLQRADSYYELALSTPTIDQDMTYFDLARQDITAVLNSDLPLRHRLRFNATLLSFYEEPFKARAFDEPITPDITENVYKQVCNYALEFTEEDDLSHTEHGQLAELVALGYLLKGDYFPYIGTRREEANIITEDNHDLYTLHMLENGGVLKAPTSVKFRKASYNKKLEVPSIITLYIGDMVLDAVAAIAPYNQNFTNRKHASAARALRLAADIMICDADNEPLCVEDRALMWTLTSNFQAPINDYIGRFKPPNYARKARVIAAAIAKEKARRARS